MWFTMMRAATSGLLSSTPIYAVLCLNMNWTTKSFLYVVDFDFVVD